MNIFHNRPLSLILCIIISGLYIFSLISSSSALLLSIFVILTALICLFIKRLTNRRRICLLLLIFVLSGMLFRLYIGLTLDSRTDDNITHYMSGTVTELEADGDAFRLRLDTLDGEGSSLLISVSSPSDKSVEVGDEIVAVGSLKRLYYGELTDENRYLLSLGVSAVCYPYEIRVEGSSGYNLQYIMSRWRGAVAERIGSLSGEDAGAFCTGLLLGDTSYMSGATTVAFSRLGITHILALSGTHITLLSVALTKLCVSLGVPKRLERVLLIIMTVFFMALVGFPSSVMRAGLMVIISTVMVMLSGYSDSITSLFVALFIIILIEPYAVLDVGLLLSFLATFAILVYANYLKSEDGRHKGIISKIKLLLMFSVFAICATQIVSSLYFDKISAISALSTLVFGLITQLIIYLSLITLILDSILPLGIPLNYLCIFTDTLSKSASRAPILEYSSRHPAVFVFSLILFCAVMYFAIGRINKRRSYIISLCIVFVISILGGVLCEMHNLRDEALIYQSGENDRILIKGDGECTVIDIGEHNVGDCYGVISLLREQKIASIDSYYLLGYGNDCDVYLNRLLSKVHIKQLVAPLYSYSDGEKAEIDATCRLYGTRLTLLCEDDMISPSSFPIIFHKLPDAGSSRTELSMSIGTERGLFSYMTPDYATQSPYAELIISESDIIAIGALGASHPKYYPEVITSEKKRLIISLPRSVGTALVSPSVTVEYEGSFIISD